MDGVNTNCGKRINAATDWRLDTKVNERLFFSGTPKIAAGAFRNLQINC